MDLKLKDKVVLVTGATSDIGREVCLRLSEEGATIALTDIDERTGKKIVGEIDNNGGCGIFLKTDVTDYEQVKENVKRVNDRFGRIDVLVYLAGYGRPKKFVESDPKTWKSMVDVLYYGMLNTTHNILPYMMEKKYGKVISVIGDSSRIGEAGISVIASARAGQVALVKSVAREVGKFNITLNCVSVGTVDTTHYPSGHIERYRDQMAKNYPLGRLGMPQDIAPMILLLCSDLSSWVTGQVISVNGGYSMV